MIAPAMKTRQDEPLVYRELARQRAEVSRELPELSLPRWSALLCQNAQDDGESDCTVQADLRFSLDDDGLAWVHGNFAARAAMRCERCLEVLETEFSGSVALCLVQDDRHATELAQACDVLVVSGDAIAVAEIIEDELLLGIPEQLCEREPCWRRPALSYPAPEGPAAEPENPFAVLGSLKTE
jgi:uncharacterized protein